MTAGRPAKPVEQKRLLGNPGKLYLEQPKRPNRAAPFFDTGKSYGLKFGAQGLIGLARIQT